MVERYYEAFNSRDDDPFVGIVGVAWFIHGESPSGPTRNVDSYLAEIDAYKDDIPDIQFAVCSLHFAADMVTVIDMLRGTHMCEIIGYAPTGRSVELSVIAVHCLEDGAIAKPWQMPDRLTLVGQIR
ncbi:ester cyclase [Aestuariibius insulae]|uniref:ester cyclase n=1 Tax=Aestuariibius insulae TaxID=2058287 RepID=UPI00345E50BD